MDLEANAGLTRAAARADARSLEEVLSQRSFSGGRWRRSLGEVRRTSTFAEVHSRCDRPGARRGARAGGGGGPERTRTSNFHRVKMAL